MSTSAEVELKFPVKLDGQEYKALTMRRPKVKDNLWLEKLTGGDLDKSVKMCARLCDVPPEVIAELDEVDMIALDRQYATFRDGAGE